MSNIWAKERNSAEELRTRLRLKSVRECLQDRRLQWFGPLERMEERKWSNKCGTFRVSGNFLRGQPKKTWNEVTRSYLKDGKVSKDKAEDKNP